MTILSAVAEFERDLIIERTQTGLERAKVEGKKLGRRFSLNDVQQQSVLADLDSGKSVSETAKKFKTSRQTILRMRKLKTPEIEENEEKLRNEIYIKKDNA